MADETRVARTAGISGTLRLPGLLDTPDGPADLDITPEGVEVTRDQWTKIAAAATANHVVVRLDEDFPFQPPAEEAPKTADNGPETAEADATTETKTEDTGTAVDGATPPAPASTGTSRKGR